MTTELLEKYESLIESITLLPSSGGVYEVTVNDQLLYSKKATGRHAEPGEVAKLVGKFVKETVKSSVKKGRVFSGARPTGRQHLGNYLGAIKNYVALQDEYDCVYCIVDLHALTTMDTTQELRANTYEMALDWLAAGIRPQESIMFHPVARAPGDRAAHASFPW